MTEIILSAAAGNLSIVDGMPGAVVVAGETAGTAAVMVPDGEAVSKRDVTGRTGLSAFTTMDAELHINVKLLVSHHLTIEIATDNIAHYPG